MLFITQNYDLGYKFPQYFREYILRKESLSHLLSEYALLSTLMHESGVMRDDVNFVT